MTAVVLVTGSIFPAMAWHALNNAVAVVPPYLGWMSDDPAYPPWLHAAGVAGLVVAAGILWRCRRPYPEVGEARRARASQEMPEGVAGPTP